MPMWLVAEASCRSDLVHDERAKTAQNSELASIKPSNHRLHGEFGRPKTFCQGLGAIASQPSGGRPGRHARDSLVGVRFCPARLRLSGDEPPPIEPTRALYRTGRARSHEESGDVQMRLAVCSGSSTGRTRTRRQARKFLQRQLGQPGMSRYRARSALRAPAAGGLALTYRMIIRVAPRREQRPTTSRWHIPEHGKETNGR
jgi:hypothetical protein